MHRKHSLIVTLFISALWASSINALESDATKEITILSNSADFDRKSGVAHYTGDVILEQGTLKITADQITLYSNENKKLTKAVAVGKPAHFQQLMEGDKGLTKAQAQTITYLTSDKHVTLVEEAYLEQEGNVFTGESIVYDMIDESVSAKGGTQTELTPEGEKKPTRIKMIIQPETDSSSEEAAPEVSPSKTEGQQTETDSLPETSKVNKVNSSEDA